MLLARLGLPRCTYLPEAPLFFVFLFTVDAVSLARVMAWRTRKSFARRSYACAGQVSVITSLRPRVHNTHSLGFMREEKNVSGPIDISLDRTSLRNYLLLLRDGCLYTWLRVNLSRV